MAKATEKLTILASQESVWDALVDFESRPRWSSRVEEAEIVGGGPLEVGSVLRLRVSGNRLSPKVVEMHPPERLVLAVKGTGFHGSHSYDVSQDGSRTVITLTGEYGGPLGIVAGIFMRGSMRRDLSDELEALKRASEAEKPTETA